MPNIPILSFNAGELSPQIDARSDVDKYGRGCRHLENMIPRIYGGAERRPGTYYYLESYNSTATIRKIPFIYSSTVAYVLEFGNLYIRALYDGVEIDTIVSPYVTADLYEIQFAQVGDVMRLVHSDYKPRKLVRTSATAFTLGEIDFRKGPFLIRNDLLDPNISDTAFMKPTATAVGSQGTLICQDADGNAVSFFDSDQVGTLFKLWHPRVNTIINQEDNGTSSAIDVEGTWSFNMQRTGSGDIVIQRRENSTVAGDWETYKTFGGSYSRNVQYSVTEEEENVEYRIYSEATDSSASLAVDTPTQTGIVRITEYSSASVVKMEVLKKLASTNATRRWAEGAWSDYRGYPSSITFLGQRCIYGGPSTVPAQATY